MIVCPGQTIKRDSGSGRHYLLHRHCSLLKLKLLLIYSDIFSYIYLKSYFFPVSAGAGGGWGDRGGMGHLCFFYLAAEAVAVAERPDSNFELSPTVGKMLSNSTACYRETACERRVSPCGQFHCCLIFKKSPWLPPPSSAASEISQQRGHGASPSSSKQIMTP